MNRRVSLYLVLLVVIGLAFNFSDRDETQFAAVFSLGTRPGTPAIVRNDQAVTSTWFCAGTSAAGESDSGTYGGEIVISNPLETPVTGLLTILTSGQAPVTQAINSDPRSQLVIEINSLVTAPYASALVELTDSAASVEQRALHPAGAAVSPCSNRTSSEWYFADGFSAESSDFRLILTNPYLSPAIVNIEIATMNGQRTPTNLQGFVIPAQSIRVLNIPESGFRDEKILAISVVASTGRIVAAKDQHFLGAGRLGHVLSLGSPSTSDQWWFADGERGVGISETYMIYNPSDQDVLADVVMLGLDPTVANVLPTTLTIPANDVVPFDVSAIVGLPDGLHGGVVSGQAGAQLVVERVLTKPAGSSVATTVVLGAQRGFQSTRWSVPTSTTIAIEDVLTILNTSPNSGVVTIYSVGPGGEEPVPGLSDIPIAANGLVSIDLVDPLSFGRALEVVSDQSILVERRLERTPTLRGRSGSLAFPEKLLP
jgi:hypothetical protein